MRIPAAASLADLHLVIQTLFGWDGDHLHAFTAENGVRVGDIDEAEEKHSISLYRVLPRVGSRLDYLYDFGPCWKHSVTLEGSEVVPARAGIFPCLSPACAVSRPQSSSSMSIGGVARIGFSHWG